MLEDIKKEISNLTTFNGGHNRMYISDLFKILDKYNNQEDYLLERIKTLKNTQLLQLKSISELDKYKNAWEELYSEREKPCGIEYMQDLEDKYKIEVE